MPTVERYPPQDKAPPHAASVRQTAGPFLKYNNSLPGSRLWRGSILFLTCSDSTDTPEPSVIQQQFKSHPVDGRSRNDSNNKSAAPSCQLTIDGMPSSTLLTPDLLDTINGWNFWRFNLSIPLTEDDQVIRYAINVNHGGVFHVPPHDQAMHWAYYSCNGMSLDVPEDSYVRKDPTYLWRDMLQVHSTYPFHILVGGGDQLYNDGIWSFCPLFSAWDNMKYTDKIKEPWSDNHTAQATEFYLNNYIQMFTSPDVSTALASIPSINMWDDHDIFDGFGSYNEDLQASPVFKGLFEVAKHFFLLFQQQTTDEYEDQAVDEYLNGTEGYHSIKYLGPQTALLCIDMRTKRSKKTILPASTYQLLRERCLQLPSCVDHLVVMSGVPLIFPSIPGSEAILGGCLSIIKASKWVRKAAKAVGFVDRFGQPEILDDVLDGWMANPHKEERLSFIHMLQDIAHLKHVRVSIISGDAHVAGIGRLYTKVHPKLAPAEDPLFMPQIISSAIMNAPPPFNVVRMLVRTNIARTVDANTKSKMVRAFWPSHPRTDKLLALRNWCDVTCIRAPYSVPMNPNDPEYGGLRFAIRAEDPKRRHDWAEERFIVEVPRAPLSTRKGDVTAMPSSISSCGGVHAAVAGPSAAA